MVDARNVSMLSLDITVHNGIASHGRATAGADHSRPQGLALTPREPRPWAIGPLGKGTGPRKTPVRTLPDAALGSPGSVDHYPRRMVRGWWPDKALKIEPFARREVPVSVPALVGQPAVGRLRS